MCESEPQTHQARARWLKVVHFNRTQELRCKVMVLGDKTVGKSALTQMFHSNGTRAPATGHLPRLSLRVATRMRKRGLLSDAVQRNTIRRTT
jgi:hypothetical protein